MNEDIRIVKEHCVETLNSKEICLTYNDAERVLDLIQEYEKVIETMNLLKNRCGN